MADTYTGAWRNRVMGLSDSNASQGQANPSRHMGEWSADLHAVDDTAATRMAVQTPHHLDPAPPDLIDASDTSAIQSSTAGVPLSNESSTDHGSDETRWSENNTERDVVHPSPVHQDDRGSMWQRKIRQPRMGQFDETLTTPRVAANPETDTSEALGRQGMQFAGTDPRNNPSTTVQRTRGDEKATNGPRVGWANAAPRIGFRIFRFDERKIAMHRPRHDTRLVPLHLARTAQDAPPLMQGNQYVSPYGTLANTRIGNVLSPMIRRMPQAWDQSAVTDGATEVPNDYQVWGL